MGEEVCTEAVCTLIKNHKVGQSWKSFLRDCSDIVAVTFFTTGVTLVALLPLHVIVRRCTNIQSFSGGSSSFIKSIAKACLIYTSISIAWLSLGSSNAYLVSGMHPSVLGALRDSGQLGLWDKVVCFINSGKPPEHRDSMLKNSRIL